jgi:uncharacterized protein (DUF305 family)
MNSFLRNAAVATLLSLSLAPIANAAPFGGEEIAQSEQSHRNPVSLMAQVQTTNPGLSEKSAMILEMLHHYMEARKMGQTSMKSSDPVIRKMGEDMVKSSDTEILKLVRMMRAEFLANPDR